MYVVIGLNMTSQVNDDVDQVLNSAHNLLAQNLVFLQGIFCSLTIFYKAELLFQILLPTVSFNNTVLFSSLVSPSSHPPSFEECCRAALGLFTRLPPATFYRITSRVTLLTLFCSSFHLLFILSLHCRFF